jgi:hypothetical protein
LTLSRRDLQRLAELRAREAGALSRSRKQQGAYYLAGYAVECALKACIAKKTKRHDFPDRSLANKVYTHDLTALLREAGLEAELDRDMQANPALAANWNTVKIWKEESRYVTTGLRGRDLHLAITGTDGVLPWITLNQLSANQKFAGA